MSNNSILLPDFVIANLYGNNLVVGNDVVAKERIKSVPTEMANQPIQEKPVELSAPKPPSQVATQPVETIPVTEKTIAAIPVIEKPAPEKPKVNNPVIEPGKAWFLGNNGKQITVMVKEDAVPYINDKHLQFLSNVLSACKLNIGDIALVNYKNFPLGYDELKTRSNPKIILAFDISPKELKLPFTIPAYQVQDYAQCRFLFAPSLSLMEGDHAGAKAEKTKLWNSLKILFQLK